MVSIEIEGEHLAELRAEAGQFFRWRFLTPDTWLTAHPFSLSAAPSGRRLRLTVKALGQGSAALQEVPVGTWVIAEGPYGAMTAAHRTRRDVLLVAGGVGITPMRALFETMPVGPGHDLLLLYRARSPAHLLFRRELEAIAARRGARLHYLLGDDRQSLSAPGLRAVVPDLPQRDVYLCGPPSMADAVRHAVRQLGLPAECLHEERFAFGAVRLAVSEQVRACQVTSRFIGDAFARSPPKAEGTNALMPPDTESSYEPATRMRATNADRDRVAALIEASVADGALTPAEGEERVQAVRAAVHRDDFPVCMYDLPAAQPPPQHTTPERSTLRGRMSAAGSLIARHRIISSIVALVIVVAIVGLGFAAASDRFDGGGHRGPGGSNEQVGDHRGR